MSVFQSQWAILWGRYPITTKIHLAAIAVSIAVGDSLGALPGTQQAVRRPIRKFQSQWAILWGRYYTIALHQTMIGHVSIAVGDSLGALQEAPF